MDGPRFFTPEEAIATLPRVKPLLVELREAWHAYRFAREQAKEATEFGAPDVGEWEERAEGLADRVQALVDRIDALGADVKDPLLGLIDFYHQRADGSVVLLCYRDDEATITHWHPLETGFAGRRPLDEL